MDVRPMQISFFRHVWEKESKVIFLKEFIDDVRGPRWAVVVRSYRDYLRRGMKKEAADLKGNMNAITGAGVFRGGHAAAQICSFSGLVTVDFDHTDERTEEVASLLRQLPYMVAVFISISGQGVKAVVRADVESAAQYAAAYPVVASELSRRVGFGYDSQCSDLGRSCFASHDPEAYYHPDAEPFAWQDGAEEQPASPIAPAPGGISVAGAMPLPGASAGGFMQGFLADFEKRNLFAKPHRNDFLLKLGRVARYKEFSNAEFLQLLQLCVQKYAKEEVTAADVEKRMMAGYQYVESNPKGQIDRFRYHQSQVSPYAPVLSEGAGVDGDEVLEKSEELRREAPYFPDDLFDRLPPLLAQGVSLARNRRERDMLLLGMIANISGCLPGVQILYDQMYCSMHLYFTAIAHAGGGKGVLALAALLPDAIHRYYEKQNRQATREYREALLRWELEQKQAVKARRMADLSLCPDEPRLLMLKVSPNISKSRLIIYLEDNAQLGVIINATELDMVSGAMRQECGKHDDVFRAAFQHEEVSSDYKIDGRQVMAHDPHLACCFAGTPSQLAAFIASLENGLYSRILFYIGQAPWEWRSAAPREGGVDYRTVFRQLSEQLLEMHLFLLQSPTEVVFTPEQWAEHTERFGGWLKEVVDEKEDSPGAIVLRHGLMAMRIAGILTALRKCECAWTMLEYRCGDDDFRTAMQLVGVLLEHSLLLSSSLPATGKQVRPLRSYFRLRPILANMKRIFTYQEFLAEVRLQELPESTAKRLLAKAVRAQIIEKEDDGYRKVGDRWKKGAQE